MPRESSTSDDAGWKLDPSPTERRKPSSILVTWPGHFAWARRTAPLDQEAQLA